MRGDGQNTHFYIPVGLGQEEVRGNGMEEVDKDGNLEGMEEVAMPDGY